MTTRTQSGELTFKQAGIMLLVIGGGVAAADLGSQGHWEWNGIPVLYMAGAFAVLGLAAAIVGVVRKA